MQMKFFLSELERDRAINESIGPLIDHWEGKEVREEREEIESLRIRSCVDWSSGSESKESSAPIKK